LKLALRELRRRPKAFFVPTAILAMLALLLLFPSSILDGIVLESTAGMRTVPADLIVYSAKANGVMALSQIGADVRAQVDGVPGTAQVATFDVYPSSAVIEGQTDSVSVALTASSEPLRGDAVPGPNEAIADESLKKVAGFAEGMTVLIGPFKRPVKIIGFASGTNLFFANGLLVDRATLVLSPTNPAEVSEPLPPETANAVPSQALLVTVESGADPEDVARDIDAATGRETITMTVDEAIKRAPGIAEQAIVFDYVRTVTLLVALVVVALFLSFMTLERAPLYAAMKAFGASSRQLFGAVVLQVVVLTAVAIAAAAFLTWSLTRMPSQVPTVMTPDRVIETTVALGFTALMGACLSLRRVMRVDAKDALG
jgi:putative ABC transport system permease protein